METSNLNVLIQILKENNEKVESSAKRIKECILAIKKEESDVKTFMNIKVKFIEEVKKKSFAICEKEITNEMFNEEKLILLEMLGKYNEELKKEEINLDILQQSICSIRMSFHNEIRELLDKRQPVETPTGCINNYSITTVVAKSEKIEEPDECESIFKDANKLQNELERLQYEEAQIEEAKQLKVYLQAEPSSSEIFLKLQYSLKNIKDELKKVEEEIKIVKKDINQKEKPILNMKRVTEYNPTYCHDFHHYSQSSQGSTSATIEQNTTCDSVDSKTVLFKDSVHMKPASTQLKSILKSRALIENAPGENIRHKLSQQLTSRLEKEMKDILFKKE